MGMGKCSPPCRARMDWVPDSNTNRETQLFAIPTSGYSSTGSLWCTGCTYSITYTSWDIGCVTHDYSHDYALSTCDRHAILNTHCYHLANFTRNCCNSTYDHIIRNKYRDSHTNTHTISIKIIPQISS